MLRQARLVSLGTLQVANRVVVVADGSAGASCGRRRLPRRFGGPISPADRGGYRLVGIVSGRAGALVSRNRSACGGLTAVTPVADHAGWIAARTDDLRRLTPGQAIARPRRRRTPPTGSGAERLKPPGFWATVPHKGAASARFRWG